jgi:hypothetical protein
MRLHIVPPWVGEEYCLSIKKASTSLFPENKTLTARRNGDINFSDHCNFTLKVSAQKISGY